MDDLYSPHTLEHIATDNPADWMLHAGKDAPIYYPSTSSCFWKDGDWVIVQAEPPKPPVPYEVTRFQARGALYQAGLLDKVEAFIAAEGTDMMLKLAWQDAQTFKRYSPFITGVGQLLGLTDEQLDALFTAASQIE